MAKKSPKPIDLSNQPSGDAAQAIGTSDHQTAEQHTRELFRREESRYREKGAANPDRQVYDYVRKDWRSDTSDFIDTIKPLTGLSGQPLVSASGTLPIGTDTKRSGEQTPLGSATQPDTNTGRTTAFSGMSIDWKQALPGAEAWNVTYGAKSGNGTDAPRTDNTNTTGTDASRPLPATKGLPNDINVTATKTELPPITPTSVTSNGMPQITPPVSERAPVSVTRSESPPTNGGSLPPSNFGTTSATKAVAKDAVSTTNNTTDGILPSIPRTINGAREVTPISTVQPSGQPISTPGLPATPGTTGGVRENPVNLRTGEQPVARLANSGQATPALPANDGRAPSPTGSPTGGTVMRPPTDTSLPKTQPADPPKKSEPASWAGTALATGNKSMVGAITNAASSQGSRTSNIITDQPSNPGTAEPGSRPASSITRPEIVGTNRTSGEPSRRADTPVNPSDTNALRVRTGDTEPKGSPSNTTPQIGRAADSGSAPNTPDVNAQRGAIPGQIAGKGIADILDTTLSPAKSATAPTTSDTTTPRSTRSLDPNPAIKTALPDLTGPQSRGGADLTLPTDKSSVRSLSAGTGTGTASDTTLPGSGSSRPDITGKGAVAPAADTAKNPETNRTETTTRTVGNNTPKSPADTTKTASPPQPETAKPAGVRGPGSTSSDAAKSEDPRAVSAKSDGGKTQISGSKPDISKADVTKTVSSGTVAGPQVDTRSEAPRAVTPKSASPNGEETKVGATKPDSPRTIPAKSDSSTKTEPPRADGVHGQPARTTGPKGDTAATKVDAPKTVPVKGESTKTANSDGTKIPPTKGDGPRSEKADGTKIIPAKGDGAKAERTDGTKIVPTKGDGARSEKTDGTKIVPTTGDGARSQKSDGTKIVPAKADGPRSEKADGTKIIPAKGDGARSEKADSTKIVPAKADGGKSERTDGNKIVPAKGDGAKSEKTDGTKIVPAKGDGAKSEKTDGTKIPPAKVDGAKSEKTDGTKVPSAKGDGAKSEKTDGNKVVQAKADGTRPAVVAGVPPKADGSKVDGKVDHIKSGKPMADGCRPTEPTKNSKSEGVTGKVDSTKSQKSDAVTPAKGDGGVNPAGATGSTKGDVPAHKQPLQSNADGTKPQEGAKHPQPLKGDKPGSSDKPPLNSPFKATTNGANKANGSEVAQQTQPKRLVSGNSDAKRDSSDAQQHVRVNKLPWEKADSQQESESRNPKTEKKELEPVSRFASILRRGRDAKDHREEKISEIKTAAELRIQHQQRTKYIVQHGDTLASIALDQLGDSRFSNLILTINRGRISMVTRNGKQEPLLHEDQVLWLPTPNERDVYAKAIFSTKNAPKHNAIEVSLMHPAHSHDEPVPSVVLENIRRVNQPHSRTLHTIDLQISQSQLLNKLNALAENVSTSVWFAGEPAGAAEQPDKKGPATQAPRFFDIPGDMPPQVELLDASCRMVTEKNDSSTFSATLEMKVTEKWLRVACYEYRHGHGYRYSYYSNGEVKPFPMDLPLHVVLEMAREDFQRNWSAYCREFSKQNGFARA